MGCGASADAAPNSAPAAVDTKHVANGDSVHIVDNHQPAPHASARHLFEATKIGDIEVKNRFIMAPLTRCRATPRTHVPTPVMVEYYAQRASAGLIIAEATMISGDHCAFYAEPGIYSAAQVEGWKKVTDAVHAKGGKIILQLQHGGRVCHSLNGPHEESAKNMQPCGPSAVGVTKHELDSYFNPTGAKIPYETPRELTEEEIPVIIGEFAQGAKNAIAAGFDGVEIHGANGYLVDQFLRASSNQRAHGRYSGTTVETRAQFALDVTTAVVQAVGAGRVGIRLSPLNSYNEMSDPEPEKLTKYLCEKLSALGVAFVHIMRADFFGVQKGNATEWVRQTFKGFVIANMGYTPEEAETAIASKAVDAVAFGTLFMANPDLPLRVLKQAPFNAPDFATAYTPGEKGYIDYPVLQVEA